MVLPFLRSPALLLLLFLLVVFPRVTRGGADAGVAATDPMRALLEHGGINAEQWNRLKDHAPLEGEENSTLLQVLFRVPKLARDSLEGWSHGDPDWEQFTESSRPHRGALFDLRGRLRALERVSVDVDSAQRWGFEHYYRATLEVDVSSMRVTVFARIVPDAWKTAAVSKRVLDEEVSALAVCIKLGESADGSVRPIFATSRIAWHATRTDADLGIHNSHVLLGKVGMDIGLFDAIQDKRPLETADRECFYQLLAATGRLSADHFAEQAADDVPLRSLLETHSVRSSRGKLVTLTGNVRRVVRIAVEASDIRQRLGIDHYFELNVFVDESVKVKRSQDDPDPAIYPRYPVVFCARQLPADMPIGEDVDEAVRITGFFYKLYAYQTDFTTARGESRGQFSPLIVGLRPRWIQRVPREKSEFGLVFAIAFLLVLAGTCFFLWNLQQRDAEFRRTVIAPRSKQSPAQSFHELNLDPAQPFEIPPDKDKD